MTIDIYPGMAVGGIGTLPLDVVKRDGGLSVLKAMLSGDLPAPPMAATLKFSLTEVEEGRVVFAGLPDGDHLNPLGTVHGGWTATVMDSALGCAVFSVVKPGEAYTTVEFKVHLVRPVVPGLGEVFCEGKIVHRGRTIATSEAWLRDGSGKLLAHGTETCAIFPIENLMR
ncbi:PaaI family thioesterase [Rhizobium sp. TRM95111]|uniref:PaaI family thioesterase n=1 Tax=Rhizobium alarense TaxID=2846851 RepID=UPI001F459DE6|nr:PaaI family thioesterase [Rhizobium alarense]MCF3641687.1 PaaI family thioesterase [Rhizobium alarense]